MRKRSGVYYLDLRTPSGERIRRSCGTSDRKEAEEYHDRVKSEMWRTSKLGERERHTYKEAVVRFLKGLSSDRDRSDKARHLRHFGEKFVGRYIDTIKATEIMAALPDKLYGGTRPGRPKSATRNRYLATIRAMLNEAANKWGWLERAPKLFEERESNKRIRWITREEAQRLLLSINTDWLRDVTAFGFATGLRRANIFDLEWSQIDLVAKRAWIHPDQAKARKPIGVPLNREAVELIRQQIGKHHHLVFTRRGKRIKVLDWNQWKAACARANIENFRFHDVRHTWASWHVQGGTPLERLKELGAWATYEMVLRYAHLAPDHLAQHAEAVTVWAQPESDICGTAIRAAS
ncbi:tyrosine-type recombinase/integrase [Burkholderia sp. IDO3]|uniref:tyrosine-type recombinase/integrase n=1 Tax=Burkholderia sp. IDO3 TaxID=1705310 RepID=UPI00345E2C10